MEVLNSLITILIIITLGISSRKAKLLEKEHVKTLSSFVSTMACLHSFSPKSRHWI